MNGKTILYTQCGSYVIYNDSSEVYRGKSRNEIPVGTCIGAVENADFEGIEANALGEFTVDKTIQGRVLRHLKQLPLQTFQHPVVSANKLIILPAIIKIESAKTTKEIRLEGRLQ